MCNCKTELEAKLLERFKANTPQAKGHGVALDGYGFVIIGNEMQIRGYMPVKATADFPKKDGFKSKTTTQNMNFSYCPFCGVKA